MQKVIGVGETLFDIVFKDNRPSEGVPGGSIFNAMVSL
ncbi:MAG: carbohydrate kinase, partial [Bacteroidales bacterium]